MAGRLRRSTDSSSGTGYGAAMATETIAYVAVSLDGYIAEEDGGVHFLEEFGSDEYDFHAFMASVGAVAMGATTYEQVLGWGWPYGDIPGLVLTTRQLATVDETEITCSSDATGDALRAYAETIDKRLWVVGGGEVITAGLEQGAIDTLELYVMPVALGTGIPLFTRPFSGTLRLAASAPFTNGVVKLVYDVPRA